MNSILPHVLPPSRSGNKRAVFFAVSDGYAFAVANVLMGLCRHSAETMKGVDVILYHNGISEQDQRRLRSIHPHTYFLPLRFPAAWKEMLSHPKTLKWGVFVIGKFFGFELIKAYEKVLHLDADMHVRGDISALFDIEEEMAWRGVIAWDPATVFAPLLPTGTPIKCGNGGMLLFTDKLARYGIDSDAVKAAFEQVKELMTGGIDETVMALLVHQNGIRLNEVDAALYNTPVIRMTPQTRLVHFLSAKAISSKPWENLAAYLYFDDWAQNYTAWLEMGGNGPIRFEKEDYFKLFSYDKAEKIRQLKQKNAQLTKEREEYAAELATLKAEREQAAAHIAALEEASERVAVLETELGRMRHSRSWRLTKPLRKWGELWRRLKRR